MSRRRSSTLIFEGGESETARLTLLAAAHGAFGGGRANINVPKPRNTGKGSGFSLTNLDTALEQFLAAEKEGAFDYRHS